MSDGYGSSGKITKRGFSESTESHDSKLLANAVAAVARAPLKDFVVVRQHWAAVRIQTTFRGFLVYSTLTHFSKSVSMDLEIWIFRIPSFIVCSLFYFLLLFIMGTWLTLYSSFSSIGLWARRSDAIFHLNFTNCRYFCFQLHFHFSGKLLEDRSSHIR